VIEASELWRRPPVEGATVLIPSVTCVCRSRTKTSTDPSPSFATRLSAKVSKATKRPSPLSSDVNALPFTGVPSFVRSTRSVVPAWRSRT
jgi:hypothetical protein